MAWLASSIEQVEPFRLSRCSKAEVLAHGVGQHILITADLPFERLDFLSTPVGQRVGISLESRALRCKHMPDAKCGAVHGVSGRIHPSNPPADYFGSPQPDQVTNKPE